MIKDARMWIVINDASRLMVIKDGMRLIVWEVIQLANLMYVCKVKATLT